MQTQLHRIDVREALHFLGWRGTPVDAQTMAQIRAQMDAAKAVLQPRVTWRRLALEDGYRAAGSTFCAQGGDVRAMLDGCQEIVLMAATLGAASEQMLLRAQAKSAGEALILDAVLSAAIESVMDEQEGAMRRALSGQGLYLTDRFSPGYGDMPLEQTREICAILQADRAIGLTVARSGIMIPRKSVTCVMGISDAPVARRPTGCAACPARETCPMARRDGE